MTKREFWGDEVWKAWTQDYEYLRHLLKTGDFDKEMLPLIRAFISYYRKVL